MSSAVRRRIAAASLVVGVAAAAPALSLAHDALIADDGGVRTGTVERHVHQHGDSSGHLPASRTNVDLVSKLALKNAEPEKIADVGVAPDGNTAFLAAWGGATCRYNGVHVVNIADPTKPREVAFIGSKEGSYPGEGVQALNVTTSAFTGDLLVTNNEICKDKAGFGGMNIYDVTNPARPTPLAEGVGDKTVNGQGKKAANEIHSVFAWDAGDKAYAVIVDNEEGKDVDILDITNPRKATLIKEYDLDETFPQIKQAAPSNLGEIFLHDMVVKKIGTRQVMLLSYWDAGYVKIDVTDPTNAQYLGDTDFTDPDPEAAESGLTVPPEGNGHQAEFSQGNGFVIGSDEDFAPYALTATNAEDGELTASQGSNTKRLEQGETITGTSVFAGRACTGDQAVPAGGAGSQVAVVERGLCTFSEKVANVVAAGGYEAVLVFNRTGTDACDETLGMSVEGDIPTFGVAPRGQGFAIFDTEYDNARCLDGTGPARLPVSVGTAGDVLTFSSYFDGWGYVHLFRNSGGKMVELDTYAIPEAHDPKFASGFGDLSIHEVATSQQNPDRAYFSYYSGGFRFADIEGDELVEKGHFIDQGGSNLWGVEVFQHDGEEYVAASDRDKGLYIFQAGGD